MSEQNKMLARRSVEEVWNGENFAAVDELGLLQQLGAVPEPEQA